MATVTASTAPIAPLLIIDKKKQNGAFPLKEEVDAANKEFFLHKQYGWSCESVNAINHRECETKAVFAGLPWQFTSYLFTCFSVIDVATEVDGYFIEDILDVSDDTLGTLNLRQTSFPGTLSSAGTVAFLGCVENLYSILKLSFFTPPEKSDQIKNILGNPAKWRHITAKEALESVSKFAKDHNCAVEFPHIYGAIFGSNVIKQALMYHLEKMMKDPVAEVLKSVNTEFKFSPENAVGQRERGVTMFANFICEELGSNTIDFRLLNKAENIGSFLQYLILKFLHNYDNQFERRGMVNARVVLVLAAYVGSLDFFKYIKDSLPCDIHFTPTPTAELKMIGDNDTQNSITCHQSPISAAASINNIPVVNFILEATPWSPSERSRIKAWLLDTFPNLKL